MKKLLMIIVAVAILSGCTSLKTPEINGVVVDAETGKPLEGAYIIARWAPEYSGPGGKTGGQARKEIKIQTSDNGSFNISAYHVINWVPYPFGQGGSFSITFYAHGFERQSFIFSNEEELTKHSKYDEVKKLSETVKFSVKVHKPQDEKKFLKNAVDVRAIDPKYTIEEYRLFIRKYPTSNEIPEVIRSIGVIYLMNLNDHEAAAKEFAELIKQYPDSSAAKYAEKELKTMQYKTN